MADAPAPHSPSSSTPPAKRPRDTLIDDRGHVIPYDAEGVRQTIRQQRRPTWYLHFWSALGAVWLIVCVYKVATNPAAFFDVKPAYLFPIGCALAFAIYRNRRAGGNPPPLTPEAAVLLAIDRCGGCGYGLQEVLPTPDGYRTCPECGGTWHTDRVLFRGPDDAGRARSLLARLETASLLHAGSFDDRGLPLKDVYQWPQSRMAWTPPPNHPAVLAMNRAVNKRGKIAAALLVAAYIMSMSLWLSLSDPRDRDTALVLVVCLLLTFVLSMVAWRWPLRSHTVRATALGSGHCPSCWAQLASNPSRPQAPPEPATSADAANPAPASPAPDALSHGADRVQFDGCRLCWRCSGAWKAKDVGGPAA